MPRMKGDLGLRAWILAGRPRTLFASVAPVVVGTAAAVQAGAFQPLPALAALLVAVAIQIGANYANDLGDYRKGADTAARVGPTRVTSAGLLSPRQVATGMWVSFGVAAVAGLYLASVAGWPVLVVGAACIAAGIAYTAGPLPLGYYGLGDLAVFIFFGLVGTVGTYYVQALSVAPLAVACAVPVGALITAILVVNNLRDVDTDREAGKRTLAVLLGRRGARLEYLALLIVAYLAPIGLLFASAQARRPAVWFERLLCGAPLGGASCGQGWPGEQQFWVLLPLVTLPLAIGLLRTVFTTVGPALNRTLAGTAQLALLYSLALGVGLLL
jgi:1,4-dihydroxy-2-naphthoate octaprenyltransferase